MFVGRVGNFKGCCEKNPEESGGGFKVRKMILEFARYL